MKRHILFPLVLASFLLFSQTLSALQNHNKCPICGTLYDTKTIETVSGSIIKLESIPAKSEGWQEGIEILLQTKNGPLLVHLGPSWYIDHQEIRLQKKDSIEVTGSRVTLDGTSLLLAKTLVKGNLELILRNEEGIPNWIAVRKR